MPHVKTVYCKPQVISNHLQENRRHSSSKTLALYISNVLTYLLTYLLTVIKASHRPLPRRLSRQLAVPTLMAGSSSTTAISSPWQLYATTSSAVLCVCVCVCGIFTKKVPCIKCYYTYSTQDKLKQLTPLGQF